MIKLFEESKRASRIFTFRPGDASFEKHQRRFEGFVSDHFNSNAGKYSENYGPFRYPLDRQLALSVELEGEEVLAASSIYQNSASYPPYVARIANRYLKAGSVRRPFGRDARRMTVQMIDQQVDYCLENHPHLKWLFISRQAPGGAKFVRHFGERILAAYSRHKGWAYTERLHLVCGGMNTPTCWHYLVFLDLTKGASRPFPQSMTIEEWRAAFA